MEMRTKVFNSSDTNVKKFVFEWDEPKAIAESVLYRYGEYRKRTVICCSVQSGCPVGCSFCGTGRFFIRNLEQDEIIGQIIEVMNHVDCEPCEIEKFQIMFMSMGEPFLNYTGLSSAISCLHMLYPNAQLLVSTSAPSVIYRQIGNFIELSKRIESVGLQFSVHESTDEARKRLIPTNTCTLRQIASIGELWASFVGRKPFFNYCVHEGNDSDDDVRRLAGIFNPDVWEVTLSVICEKDESVKVSIDRQLERIGKFNILMSEAGFHTRVFNPAGQDDIGGGCGQLWYFQEWLGANGIK